MQKGDGRQMVEKWWDERESSSRTIFQDTWL